MVRVSSQRLRLPDGRAIGYAEYGAPQGHPVLYFHGCPGSRLEAGPASDVAARLGARLVAIDRPGYGLSDFKAGRQLIDWPDDVEALADSLGLGRFSVLGVSGGGPYAAVCAYRLAPRLVACGVVCGLAPLDAPETLAALRLPERLALLSAQRAPFEAVSRLLRRHPHGALALLASVAPAPDRTALRDPTLRAALAEALREAVRGGSRGTVRDAALYTNPCGFDLAAIAMEVHLWHGEQDTTVPVQHGLYIAARIPLCSATFYPEEGHFSLPFNRMRDIIAALLPESVRCEG